ncbi:hypothetical protein PC110_g7609 [Phytophthora cactorum]|uniref:Uncharacterized protein n=1 Tax=Phytophthora cactorum TaxID=29920 RepID=A0A329SH32_9STRA|nr:hypothetical protein PC111_g22040 [Phytophthora cactorum]KAG4042316.1 hypothetical protein PC123_g22188 [Phytophthora cactorum]RAW36114.1 hypothetical protein PC110_g7609 [Phytophthora cactorum]
MHSKILAVLGLWITSVILQAADARAPVGMAPRRHLGSYKEYPHEHDKNHSHHRRRLQGRSIKATGHQVTTATAPVRVTATSTTPNYYSPYGGSYGYGCGAGYYPGYYSSHGFGCPDYFGD